MVILPERRPPAQPRASLATVVCRAARVGVTNVGVELISPETPFGRWGASVLYEDLSRDDSLVAWASAQGLFGVTLGARERSTIVKVYHPLNDNVTAFFFLNRLANPFPELSALRPISGPAREPRRQRHEGRLRHAAPHRRRRRACVALVSCLADSLAVSGRGILGAVRSCSPVS